VVGVDVGLVVGVEGAVGVEVVVLEVVVLEGLGVVVELVPAVGAAGVTGPQALAVRVSAASAMTVRVWRAVPLGGAYCMVSPIRATSCHTA